MAFVGIVSIVRDNEENTHHQWQLILVTLLLRIIIIIKIHESASGKEERQYWKEGKRI